MNSKQTKTMQRLIKTNIKSLKRFFSKPKEFKWDLDFAKKLSMGVIIQLRLNNFFPGSTFQKQSFHIIHSLTHQSTYFSNLLQIVFFENSYIRYFFAKKKVIDSFKIVIYVPVLCALWSVMRYYGPTVLIVGRQKPVFEGLKFFNFARGPAQRSEAGPRAKLKN